MCRRQITNEAESKIVTTRWRYCHTGGGWWEGDLQGGEGGAVDDGMGLIL